MASQAIADVKSGIAFAAYGADRPAVTCATTGGLPKTDAPASVVSVVSSG